MIKVKKYLSLVLGLLLMGTTMTSCLKTEGNNDYTTTQVINLCYLQCQNLQGTESFINSKASFTLEFNYTNSTVSITIAGLKDFSSSYPSVILKDMPFTMNDDGMRIVRQATWKGTIEGFYDLPEFTNVSFQFADRVFQEGNNSGYAPIMSLEFTLNNQCNMVFVPTTMFYFGPSTSTNAQGDVEKSPRSWYCLLLDPDKSTASIAAYALSIATTEQKYENFIISGIPYEFNMNSRMVTINTDKTFVPSYQNYGSTVLTQYKGYEVSNVKVVAPIVASATFTFDCTVTKDDKEEKYTIFSNPGLPAVFDDKEK